MFTQGKLKISGVLNSTFLKRTKIVLYGIIISQVIAFATSFVITSYFRPEDLGILGTLSALISIIAGTLSFRLEIAVIQRRIKSNLLQSIICLEDKNPSPAADCENVAIGHYR